MNRKIGMTALSLVFVATIMLGAFAMWSETLKINTTVNTGSVAVEFSKWACNDQGADPQLGEPFNNSEHKDVAQCYVSAEKYDEQGNVIKLNVTIVNAYPGYHAVVAMAIDNIGTIPVKLYNSSINYNGTDLAVSLTHEGNSTQIHPGEHGTFYLTIDVLQSASENTQYTFEVTMTFAQWNEVSTP